MIYAYLYTSDTDKGTFFQVSLNEDGLSLHGTDAIGQAINKRYFLSQIKSWVIEDDKTLITFNKADWGYLELQGAFEKPKSRAQIAKEVSNQYSANPLKNWGCLIKSVVFLLVLGGLALGLGYLFTAKLGPVFATLSSKFIPTNAEIQLSNYLYDQQMQSPSQINKKATVELENFVSLLDFANADGYAPKVIVLNDSVFNAGAYPGGYMVFYEPMLKALPNEEALVALLGHEWAHVTNRHSTKNILSNLGLQVAFYFILGDYGSTVFLSKLAELGLLANSRNYEREADEGAFVFLERNKVNASGAVFLHKTLQKEGDKNSVANTIPDFLSTHPDTEDRLDRALENSTNAVSFPPRADLKASFVQLKAAVGVPLSLENEF